MVIIPDPGMRRIVLLTSAANAGRKSVDSLLLPDLHTAVSNLSTAFSTA